MTVPPSTDLRARLLRLIVPYWPIMKARILLLASVLLLTACAEGGDIASPPGTDAGDVRPTDETEDEPESRVSVPDVVGLKLKKARTLLRDADLGVDVRRKASEAPRGTVLRQRPASGVEVRPGHVVNLVIAKPRPLPPPSTPNCHPSYVGVCLKVGAGDYDCAGGSGDGPNYVEGPVTVVGPDEFRLDGDGDGIGCE